MLAGNWGSHVASSHPSSLHTRRNWSTLPTVLLLDSLTTEGQGRDVIAHKHTPCVEECCSLSTFWGVCGLYPNWTSTAPTRPLSIYRHLWTGSGGCGLKTKGMVLCLCLGPGRSDRHRSLINRNRLKEFSSGQIPAVAKFLGPRREQSHKIFLMEMDLER